SGITLIKGNGSYPPPPIRRIYPDKALLWKYYLTAFVTWLLALSALVVLTTFFIAVSSRKINPPFFTTPEFQLFSLVLFIVLTLTLSPLVLFSLFLYVRSFEYIVHGDEIIVKKGLFNKTIKYCPFRTITNISTQVGVFDRIFEIGCINIQTSGASGTSGGKSEEKLEGLRVYQEIREYIIAQIRVVGGRSSPPKEMIHQAILDELLLVKSGFEEFKRKKKR
ncbi:MAG: PH domain-containing protein, partial [Candidatus Heimdallarchaeota archaeon]|nr:PH domain-containing protein [Candidatus Heimdallarchaeota archaeon]